MPCLSEATRAQFGDAPNALVIHEGLPAEATARRPLTRREAREALGLPEDALHLPRPRAPELVEGPGGAGARARRARPARTRRDRAGGRRRLARRGALRAAAGGAALRARAGRPPAPAGVPRRSRCAVRRGRRRLRALDAARAARAGGARGCRGGEVRRRLRRGRAARDRARRGDRPARGPGLAHGRWPQSSASSPTTPLCARGWPPRRPRTCARASPRRRLLERTQALYDELLA